MEKTFSQRIARFFEIADYVLLIPALWAVLTATLFIKDAFWFTLLIYGIIILGVVLLIGYFKHSRGKLDEKLVTALWIGTIVYNLALLLPVATFFSHQYVVTEKHSYNLTTLLLLLPFFLSILWWVASVIAAILALKNFKESVKHKQIA